VLQSAPFLGLHLSQNLRRLPASAPQRSQKNFLFPRLGNSRLLYWAAHDLPQNLGFEVSVPQFWQRIFHALRQQICKMSLLETIISRLLVDVKFFFKEFHYGEVWQETSSFA
jgi:hypothetical protein